MIRNQIYLNIEQIDRLKNISIETGASKSEVIRRILNKSFDIEDKKQYRLVEENKKTGFKAYGKWFKNKAQVQLVIDSCKKSNNIIYWIQEK